MFSAVAFTNNSIIDCYNGLYLSETATAAETASSATAEAAASSADTPYSDAAGAGGLRS